MALDQPAHEPAPAIAVASGILVRAMRARWRRGWARFQKLTQIGLPARFPIVQFPNAPLILALVAGAVASTMHGASRSYATATAYLAMTIWAYGELTRGVNWFRRLLGAAFVIFVAVRVAQALQA